MSRICILPIGKGIDHSLLTELSQTIRETFGVETRILEQEEEPHFAFDAKREQYLSIPILKRILECTNDDAEKILGVTCADLFVPILKYVFGQAQFSGRAALVSICRLRQQFYDLPEDRRLLAIRLKKEAVHELGHTYGLVHCRNPACVMHYSNSLREVDAKLADFCTDCLSLLRGRTPGESLRE